MHDPGLIHADDLPIGEGLLVGLSGGMDSVVLLHALAMQPQARARGLRAVHVNHGLHADADAWQRHCETICAAMDIPLHAVPVEVARDCGLGLEAAARRARHAAFAQVLDDGDVLVLAHHRDDQAETFLLRALRGSGVDGLAAMRPWRRFANGWSWRPLLDRSRAELERYATANDLCWIEDPSNADSRFDRNFLRNEVLPLLRTRWPHADAAFAQASRLCAEAEGLLQAEDTAALARARTADPHVLACDALLPLPPARRARVLRRWIAELALPPLPAEGVARIEADLLAARPDAEPRFDWHGATVRAWGGLLYAAIGCTPLPPQWRCEWDGAAPLRLPDGSLLEFTGIGGFGTRHVVHARRGGERITLPGRTHSHALKHVLQELGLPPWERECLPLLSRHDGELLAAGDVVVSAGFDGWLRATGHRMHWHTVR